MPLGGGALVFKGRTLPLYTSSPIGEDYSIEGIHPGTPAGGETHGLLPWSEELTTQAWMFNSSAVGNSLFSTGCLTATSYELQATRGEFTVQNWLFNCSDRLFFQFVKP